MRKQPPHQTNTVLSWVGWSWLKRTKGKDCRLALSVKLLTFAKNVNVFATTRADERVMRYASDHGFEINGKPYPSGRGYDLVLYLRNAARFPDTK
jgi:hypothetical protein